MDNGSDARDGKTFYVTGKSHNMSLHFIIDPATNHKIGTLPELTRLETAEAISHALPPSNRSATLFPVSAPALRKWFELCQATFV